MQREATQDVFWKFIARVQLDFSQRNCNDINVFMTLLRQDNLQSPSIKSYIYVRGGYSY